MSNPRKKQKGFVQFVRASIKGGDRWEIIFRLATLQEGVPFVLQLEERFVDANNRSQAIDEGFHSLRLRLKQKLNALNEEESEHRQFLIEMLESLEQERLKILESEKKWIPKG